MPDVPDVAAGVVGVDLDGVLWRGSEPIPGSAEGVARLRDAGLTVAFLTNNANPTLDEQQHKVEAHLIDWSGSLYGQPLELDFLQRLRDIHPFASAVALQTQLAEDVKQTQTIVAEE